MSKPTLRARLRADTRSAHDRVDAAFSAFDLTSVTGLAQFLAAQRAAYRALAAAGFAQANGPAERAEADLRTLGWTDGQAAVPRLYTRPDALAVDYVLLGAQLGSQVLARDWARATDPLVRAADQYMRAPHDSRAWRDLCLDLEARPADGALADHAVAGAIAVFDLFETCAMPDDAKTAVVGQYV